MFLGIGFYRPQSATDLVVQYAGGVERARGQGLSFFYSPRTVIARIPTTDQLIPFHFVELTADGLEAVVDGEILVRYKPEDLLRRRDFTINPATDKYVDPASQDGLHNEVRYSLQTFVRKEVQAKSLNEVLQTKQEIEDAVQAAVIGDKVMLSNLGVQVIKLYVTAVGTASADLKKALEAKKREELLGDADKAVADRRQKQAVSDRALRTFEAETALNLEQQRAELIDVQNTNSTKEATAEKEATELRLAPYQSISPAILLGLALREAAENGNIGQLHISPELFSMLQNAVQSVK